MSEMNKRRFLMIGAGVLALGGLGAAVLAKTGKAAAFEHVTLPVSEMTANGALLVDIRTPPEWAQTGVIEDARLIEFNFEKPTTFLPQIAADLADGRDLVLICNSGNRSQVVADYLSKQIPNRIVSIKGGIQGVLASGYKTVPAP